MLVDGGGGGSMYAVQIESLETFQQRLTTILQSLEQDNSVMSMNDGSSNFGDFPEGQAFASAYEQTKQDLIDSFNEVTQLVNTMINVVGSSANRYRETEQEITTKFNAVLQQFGDSPTTYSQGSGSGSGAGSTYGSGSGTGGGSGAGSTYGSGSGAFGTTYYPQNTGSTYATQNPGPGDGTGSGGDGSGSGDNGTGSGTGTDTNSGSGSGSDTSSGSDTTSNSDTSAGAA